MIPDWLSGFRITGTWDEHRANGSPGGIDWGTPVGTVIYAPSEGVVDFRYFGDGSSVIRVKRPDGTATEFLHGHLTADPGPVTYRQPIGVSDGRPGTDGAGPSDGAHLHAHDVTASGVRVPPFTTIAAEFASLSVTSLIEQEEEETMKPLLLEINNADKSTQWALVSGDLSKFVPIWKTDTANALSRLLAAGTTLKSAIVVVSKGEWNEFRKAAGLEPDPKVGK